MLLKLFLIFAKVGIFSFGGGYVVIPLLYRETVTLRQWLSAEQMTDMIAVAQMTPGPIAINLATFVGYQMSGFTGATAATLGIIFPSAVLALLVAKFLSRFSETNKVKKLLAGIRPVVIALIASAALFLINETVVDVWGVVIAAVVFLVSLFTRMHPVFMIVIAGVMGMIVY